MGESTEDRDTIAKLVSLLGFRLDIEDAELYNEGVTGLIEKEGMESLGSGKKWSSVEDKFRTCTEIVPSATSCFTELKMECLLCC